MQIVKSHPLKLGIIGGLGPLATAWFYELVTRMTKADCDQDHLDIMILSKPGIPDRTAYIIDKNKKNPVPEIIISGRQLAAQGAEILVMPCVTAHCFYDQIDQALTVPVVNMISETAECLKQEGFHRVGLMATDGTIGCQLFQRTLDSLGIETVIPDRKSQQGIMHIIYNNIKADREIEMGYFERARDDLRKKGAEVIILGCTELSLIKRDYSIGSGYLDSLEVLAKCAIERCSGQLRPEASDLIAGINNKKKESLC